MKRSRIIIFIGVSLFLIYALYYNWHTDNRFDTLLKEKGIYTIGIIDKIETLSKGGPLSHIVYTYANEKFEGEYIGDLDLIPKPRLGKRFFIEIIPTSPKMGIYFNPNFSVPDSVGVAPVYGWSQEWMKTYFPEYIKK